MVNRKDLRSAAEAADPESLAPPAENVNLPTTSTDASSTTPVALTVDNVIQLVRLTLASEMQKLHSAEQCPIAETTTTDDNSVVGADVQQPRDQRGQEMPLPAEPSASTDSYLRFVPPQLPWYPVATPLPTCEAMMPLPEFSGEPLEAVDEFLLALEERFEKTMPERMRVYVLRQQMRGRAAEWTKTVPNSVSYAGFTRSLRGRFAISREDILSAILSDLPHRNESASAFVGRKLRLFRLTTGLEELAAVGCTAALLPLHERTALAKDGTLPTSMEDLFARVNEVPPPPKAADTINQLPWCRYCNARHFYKDCPSGQPSRQNRSAVSGNQPKN